MQNHGHERCQRETPSFSASLLDAIYRSIDESSGQETKTKRECENANLKASFLLEDGETIRRAFVDDENRTRIPKKSRPYSFSSSSFDSSYESDGSRTRNLGMTQEKEKAGPERKARATSKVMKIYGDLKKLKQPVSPGRRLTNFLNSLFNSRNPKQELDSGNFLHKSRSVKAAATSPSCLSKPPSRSNSKRSVRFYPVTCIYEDDRSPIGRKLVDYKMFLDELKNKTAFQDVENNDDDDDRSCSSSDLFELENIDAIGVGRAAYTEELPVYGTTSLRTNRTIAIRLI